MRTYVLHALTTAYQEELNSKLNSFSAKHKVLGRLSALPVSLIDVSMDILKAPLAAIEHVAMAALNLLGAAFSQKYTLKDAIWNVETALGDVAMIPIKIVVAPFKVVHQFFAILIDPTKVNSCIPTRPTFKS